MDNKKLTKKVLTEVANDLSKVMDFEKPIETGDKVAKSSIITDLKEAAKELLPKDEISDLSREVLTFLKVKLPEVKEKEEKKEKEEEKTKKPVVKKKKISATMQICKMICEDFDISNEQIQVNLNRIGATCSNATISMQATDTRKAIAYLQKLGKL